MCALNQSNYCKFSHTWNYYVLGMSITFLCFWNLKETNEKYAEVTKRYGFVKTTIKSCRKTTPAHTPSLSPMVYKLSQILPNCAIRWPKKRTKGPCQVHPLVPGSSWIWFGVKWFIYPKNSCYFEFGFRKCWIQCIFVFRFLPGCPQLLILPKSPQRF